MNLTHRFKTIGNLLVGRDLQAAKSMLPAVQSSQISSTEYRGGESLMPDKNFWFFGSNGVDYNFSYSGHKSSVNAYTNCAPLTAIINKKAQAFINGRTWVTNSKGKEAKGENANKIRKLLNEPNPIQSRKDFECQGYIYQQLFGYNIILFIKPPGFTSNLDASHMWNIPPSMVDIEETKRLFFQTRLGGIINKIVLTYKGEKIPLKVEDVIIVKDITPSFKTLVFPESRICALRDPINNIIAGYEARRVLMKRRGALGILSNDSTGPMGPEPLLPVEKENLQKGFMNYGIMPEQFQVLITSASLKWQNMGYPTRDLMLFEEIEDDIMRISDTYNFPYRLIANQRTNALGGSDIKDFKLILYQDAIIPEAENYYEQVTRGFAVEELNLKIEKDFSHIAVLQEDKVQAATARKTLNEAKKIEFEMGLITLDDWLLSLDEDPIPDGLGQVRSTDPKNSSVPLAVTIGVGGVTGLIALLTAAGLSPEARQAAIEIVFGVAPADAQRMCVAAEPPPTNQNPSNNNPEQITEEDDEENNDVAA